VTPASAATCSWLHLSRHLATQMSLGLFGCVPDRYPHFRTCAVDVPDSCPAPGLCRPSGIDPTTGEAIRDADGGAGEGVCVVLCDEDLDCPGNGPLDIGARDSCLINAEDPYARKMGKKGQCVQGGSD